MSMTKSVARIVGLVPADGAEPQFSPRQKLRTAISAANAARAELGVLQETTAFGGDASRAAREAEASVEAARAQLAESKHGTYVAFVQRAMGQPEGVGTPIAQARLDLQVCEDELEAARDALKYLEGQIADAEGRLSGCELRVAAAVNAVIIAEVSPYAAKVWEHHAKITREARELDGVVKWLARLAPSSEAGGPNPTIGNSHLTTPMHAAHDGAVNSWDAARRALHTDADAKLPPIPGVEPAPSSKR
jgi:hypothetical protein